MAVKRRWEISTIVFTVLAIITIILNWGGKDKIISLLLSVGDVWIVMILFSVIGRFCQPVHNYSLIVCMVVRGAWVIVQLELVLKNSALVEDYFDYSAWQTNFVVRIVTPLCMLFLTQFNVYLFFILPFTLVMSATITTYTENIFVDTLSCSSILVNYSMGSTVMRDFALIFFISMGLYSHKSTLVSRFITNERSQL